MFILEQVPGKIFAVGDFFLVPSLYEPCGLTDFIVLQVKRAGQVLS